MENIKNILFHRKKKTSKQEETMQCLFESCYDKLVYFAVQLVNDHAIGEDIVQESFVQLWNNINSIQNNSSVYQTYLYRSVKNNSLNYLRHEKVRGNYADYYTLHADAIEESILEKLIETEVISHLHEALESLPQHFQHISKLSYVDGKKNHEVAEELGISINTLKKQKQKALELLRLKLTTLFQFLLAFIFLS